MGAVALGQDSGRDPHERWLPAIEAFEKSDRSSPPPKNSVLFVGSSSIRGWNLEKSFPETDLINRGFGGSEIADCTHFAERLIVPHLPHTVVLYAGDNDMARGKGADQVVSDFKTFVAKLRPALSETHVAFLAIKPSFDRWELWPKMKQANEAIATICAEDEKLHYLDIAKVTLGENGRPRPEMFAKDGLHLSPKGYAAWAEVVRPYIKRRIKEAGRTESP